MRKTNENNKQSQSQKSKECNGKHSGKSEKNCK